MKLQKALAVIGAGVLLFAAFDGVTYAATGSSLVLGRFNSANATTTISNTGTTPALRLLTTSTATPPLVVNGKGKVANLYADRAATADNATKLGGKTSAQIVATARAAGVISVAKSGGQFTSVRAAMNSIADTLPHLIMVAPGTYVETAPIVMKNNVDLAGSGQDRTTITCACAISLAAGARSTVYVGGDISTEIRDITLTNTGGLANLAAALEFNGTGANASVVDTTLTATASTAPSSAVGLFIGAGAHHPHIDDISTFTTGANLNFGVLTHGDVVTIRNSWLYVAGPGNSVWNDGPGIRLIDSIVNGPTQQLVARCVNVFDINNDIYSCA